jgi:hypothetical protein
MTTLSPEARTRARARRIAKYEAADNALRASLAAVGLRHDKNTVDAVMSGLHGQGFDVLKVRPS